MSAINNVMKDCIKLLDLMEPIEELNIWDEQFILDILFIIDGIYLMDNYNEQFEELHRLAKNKDLNELLYVLNNKIISLWEENIEKLKNNDYFHISYKQDKGRLNSFKCELEEKYKNKSLRRLGEAHTQMMQESLGKVYQNMIKEIIRFRDLKMYSVVLKYKREDLYIGNSSSYSDYEKFKQKEILSKKTEKRIEFIKENKEIFKELYFVIKYNKWKKNCIKCKGITAEEIANIICKDNEVDYVEVYTILTNLWEHQQEEGEKYYYVKESTY